MKVILQRLMLSHFALGYLVCPLNQIALRSQSFLSVWGLLASKEVKEAGVGNIALHDRTSLLSPPPGVHYAQSHTPILLERLALQWIQKYIRQFGGDPSKVTM
jgi:hypothetical protein